MNIQEHVAHLLSGALGGGTHAELIDYQGDGRHYFLRVVSSAFTNKSRIERSRMVYRVIGQMIQKDQLHAVQMELKTPEES